MRNEYSVKIPVEIFYDSRLRIPEDFDIPHTNVHYELDIEYRNYGIKNIDIILQVIWVSYFKGEQEFFLEVSPSIKIEKETSHCYCTPKNLVIYLYPDDTVDYEKSYLEVN